MFSWKFLLWNSIVFSNMEGMLVTTLRALSDWTSWVHVPVALDLPRVHTAVPVYHRKNLTSQFIPSALVFSATYCDLKCYTHVDRLCLSFVRWEGPSQAASSSWAQNSLGGFLGHLFMWLNLVKTLHVSNTLLPSRKWRSQNVSHILPVTS